MAEPYDSDIKKVGKNWVYYIEIIPRTCDNVYGVNPCTASGGQCAYSWGTCEDPANFVLGTTTFKFSSKLGLKVFEGTQVQPTLESVSDLPTEINPSKSVTINARIQMTFEDVKNPPPFHSEKGSGKFYPYRNATFWRIFDRIYKESYKYCTVRIYEGLPSYTSLSDFSLKRELLLNNIVFMNNGKVRVTATDKTRKAKTIKAPNAISSTNVTTAGLSDVVATIPMTDGNEFKELAAGVINYAKIIDSGAGDEYISFAAISGDNLTGAVRGLFGTTNVAHDAGVKVIQVAGFVDPADTGISSDTGINPVNCILNILLGWIGYDAGDIDVTQFQNERDNWYPSLKYRRIIETPVSVEKLLTQLNQFMMSSVWQNEDQKLTFKGLTPVPPGEARVEFNTDENVLDNSLKINNKIETQVSRVTVHFSPDDTWGTKDHKDADDFSEHLIWIDAAAENDNGNGEPVEIEFFADWIYDLPEAQSFASRYIRRYAPYAPAEINFEVYRRDAAVQTGDTIDFTSDKFVKDDGSNNTLNFQILSKSESQSGVIKMKALETKFYLKYGFITPNTQPDWTAATEAEQLYGYICDTVTELMSDGEPASYIW